MLPAVPSLGEASLPGSDGVSFVSLSPGSDVFSELEGCSGCVSLSVSVRCREVMQSSGFRVPGGGVRGHW